MPLFMPEAMLLPLASEDSTAALHMGHCAMAGALNSIAPATTIISNRINFFIGTKILPF